MVVKNNQVSGEGSHNLILNSLSLATAPPKSWLLLIEKNKKK